MKHQIPTIAALAALTIASPASASTILFADNFNTEAGGVTNFNNATNLSADQSGMVATKTYTVTGVFPAGDFTFQRGNGGTMLMHANNQFGWGNEIRASVNHNFALDANSLNLALEIGFNISVSGAPDVGATWWTAFAIGSGQNLFVTDSNNKFSGLFRDNGGTQQFGAGAVIGGSTTFVDDQRISFLISNATGSGSAFNSDGSTDVVKMFVNGNLANTWTNLNFGSADGYISFQASNTVAQIDNLTITAVPEPSAALLGGLSVLALLRRRRA